MDMDGLTKPRQRRCGTLKGRLHQDTSTVRISGNASGQIQHTSTVLISGNASGQIQLGVLATGTRHVAWQSAKKGGGVGVLDVKNLLKKRAMRLYCCRRPEPFSV